MASVSESYFGIEELFFSRTDFRGIIISGNSVFKRVSGYEWKDLLGHPHNVVRHSDMPRGVFFLLWKTIGSRAPIAAYVKNQSKNGDYYWVFALVLPLPDGYLSIRLKPSSKFFDVVKAEYQSLLQIEKKEGLQPEASCNLLESVLLKKGFKSYKDFMTRALLEELSSREIKLGRDPDRALKQLQKIISMSEKLNEKSKELAHQFQQSSFIPLNLTVQASRLASAGDPIAVVANKYAQMTAEMRDEFNTLEKVITVTEDVLMNAQYSLCAASLQQEVETFFKTETGISEIDIASEAALLRKTHKQGIEQAMIDLTKILDEFALLRAVHDRLRAVATGLDIVRLTGKIEISRLNENREQLDHLIGELFKFKTYLDQSIREVADAGTDIQASTNEILDSLR